jgi:hypothetical protein
MSGTKIKGYDTIVVYEWNEWGKSGGGILAKYKISIHLQSVLFPCSLKINTHWSLFFIELLIWDPTWEFAGSTVKIN